MHYPSGPKGNLVRTAIEFRNNPAKFIINAANYGDIAHFRIAHLHCFLLNRPEYVHQALVSEAPKFYKDALTKFVAGKFAGNGLVLNDGDSHKRQRKLMQPAFAHKRIETYAQIMTARIQAALDTWQDKPEISLIDEAQAITLDVVCRCLFFSDVSEDLEAAAEAMHGFHDVLGVELREAIPLPDWLPIERKRKLKKAIQAFDRITQKMIDAHRASDEDHGDLLSMLIAAVDDTDGSQMTNKQLRDEAVTLFIAGHETTASLITWALYLIAENPDTEKKLHQEVDQVLSGRPATLADLPNLPYTDKVLKETLRLYPAAWLLSREPREDVTFGDVTVPKHSIVFLSPYTIQRNSEFFEEPERFNPDRFSGDFEKQLPKGSYFPFGLGPRICIGQQFALMEAKLALAMIANRYELKLIAGEKPGIIGTATIRPDKPIAMSLKTREHLLQPETVF